MSCDSNLVSSAIPTSHFVNLLHKCTVNLLRKCTVNLLRKCTVSVSLCELSRLLKALATSMRIAVPELGSAAPNVQASW